MTGVSRAERPQREARPGRPPLRSRPAVAQRRTARRSGLAGSQAGDAPRPDPDPARRRCAAWPRRAPARSARPAPGRPADRRRPLASPLLGPRGIMRAAPTCSPAARPASAGSASHPPRQAAGGVRHRSLHRRQRQAHGRGDLLDGHRLHPAQDEHHAIARRQPIEQGVELGQQIARLEVGRAKRQVRGWRGRKEGEPAADLAAPQLGLQNAHRERIDEAAQAVRLAQRPGAPENAPQNTSCTMSSASVREPSDRSAVISTMGANRRQVSAIAQDSPAISPRARSASLAARPPTRDRGAFDRRVRTALILRGRQAVTLPIRTGPDFKSGVQLPPRTCNSAERPGHAVF